MTNSSRISHRRCSLKNRVLKYLTKCTGKHLCQSLRMIKLQTSACIFIKKETLAQVFSFEFCKNFKNISFTKYLWATASVHQWKAYLVSIWDMLIVYLCPYSSYIWNICECFWKCTRILSNSNYYFNIAVKLS